MLALLALASGVTGAVLGAREGEDGESRAVPARTGRALDHTSFLARIVPARGRTRPAPQGPPTPRSVRDLARRLPLERKVAQLFVFGFEGIDATAEIYERLRRLDLGGVLIERENYTDPTQLAAIAGEVRVVAREAGHVPPWVLAEQDGAEFNSLPDLPPGEAPADLDSADEARALSDEAATTLRGLNLTGLLGPVVDVGSGPLGARVYSDDPREVAGYAQAVVGAYRAKRLFSAVKHFPGLGAADQSTQVGPATVGLDLPQLRERDLIPFREAIRAGVPAIVVSHGLYPVNDFTAPASLSRAVLTDLLRAELGFAGVAVTDDLADPAITSQYSVADAAVRALRAGADLLVVSGPLGDQQAAYSAVLRAVERGQVSRARLREALQRALNAKRDYGLVG